LFRLSRVLPALFVSTLGFASCATALPPDPIERALYVDTLTLVRSQARDEWTVDRIAQDGIAPGVAWSACQVAPERRRALLGWLDGQIATEETRLGGDAKTAWLARGKELGEVDDLLELQRVRAALNRIDERPEDCPFWLEEDPEFIGMQGDAHRFIMYVESRGQLALNVQSSGGARFSGGGGGRVLLGGGLSDRVSLLSGLEVGGGGRFGEDGSLSGVLTGALPVLVRFANAGSAIDVELAAVSFLEGSKAWPPGIRAAVALGFQTPRVGGAFAPHAMFWLGYEYHPRRDDEEPFHVIGLGTRIGVTIDP
jgi:hypothetical protein